MKIPKAQEIYRHFKGNRYQIITLAEHTETGEQLVIYQAMYGDFKIYARPLGMFCSKVDKGKYPDVSQEYRFQLEGLCGEDRQGASGLEKIMEETNREETMSGILIKEAGMTVMEEELSVVEEPIKVELDPGLLEFLDADTYTARLNILTGMHHRITDELLTTMAIACDLEVEEGDLESRYQSLKNCLSTLERYEISRE